MTEVDSPRSAVGLGRRSASCDLYPVYSCCPSSLPPGIPRDVCGYLTRENNLRKYIALTCPTDATKYRHHAEVLKFLPKLDSLWNKKKRNNIALLGDLDLPLQLDEIFATNSSVSSGIELDFQILAGKDQRKSTRTVNMLNFIWNYVFGTGDSKLGTQRRIEWQGVLLFSTICLRVNACGLANSSVDREKWLSALGIRLRPLRAR